MRDQRVERNFVSRLKNDLSGVPVESYDVSLAHALRRASSGVGVAPRMVAGLAVTALVVAIGLGLASVLNGVNREGTSSRAPTGALTATMKDVTLTASLVPIDRVSGVADRGPWNYVVDVELRSTAAHGDYAMDVYPYVAGLRATVLDFGAGFDSAGRAIGSDGITSGTNGQRLAAAVAALRGAGHSVPDSWSTEGISVVGNPGSVHVRFVVAVDRTQVPLRNGDLAVVLVYAQPHEHDVSWKAVFPVAVP
jgi:hypothetical protein